MLKKIIAIITVVSLCLLFVLLNLTTPATVGPFGILAIFLFAYASSFGLVAFFIFGVSHFLKVLFKVFIAQSAYDPIGFKKACYFSLIIAAAPVMLIGLCSVGENGLYGYLLVIAFTIIGCFYLSKRMN